MYSVEYIYILANSFRHFWMENLADFQVRLKMVANFTLGLCHVVGGLLLIGTSYQSGVKYDCLF